MDCETDGYTADKLPGRQIATKSPYENTVPQANTYIHTYNKTTACFQICSRQQRIKTFTNR